MHKPFRLTDYLTHGQIINLRRTNNATLNMIVNVATREGDYWARKNFIPWLEQAIEILNLPEQRFA